MKADEGSGIRIENAVPDNRPPSCCLCLDVRIGAVLIGLLYLVIYSAWLAVNTPKLIHQHQENKDWQYYDFHYYAEKHNVDRNAVAMVIACLIFLLVVMMMYGAALRRSNFILPFFCWQVFDMCRLVMTAATMISYADRVKFHLESLDNNDNLKYISLPRFRMMLVTVSLIILTVVYYMMTVIWDCFKHAKLVEQRRARIEAVPNYMVCQSDVETMTLLLPSYDDVVKSSPPPAYTQ